VGAACALSLLAASPVTSQESLFERLNLDRLRLTALGVAAGPVRPSRVEPTQGYSIHADYGEIARGWRVVFGVTYWGSHFRDEVVDEFAARLRDVVIDPAGDDTIRVGRVSLSDVALEADVRYMIRRETAVRPFVGGGFGAHVINAEGAFIQGTIVESALDNIAAGISAAAGLETAPLKGLSLNVQGRVSLLSNARFLSLRAGGSYFFHSDQRSSRSP
jgi:hypothetical protein